MGNGNVERAPSLIACPYSCEAGRYGDLYSGIFKNSSCLPNTVWFLLSRNGHCCVPLPFWSLWDRTNMRTIASACEHVCPAGGYGNEEGKLVLEDACPYRCEPGKYGLGSN